MALILCCRMSPALVMAWTLPDTPLTRRSAVIGATASSMTWPSFPPPSSSFVSNASDPLASWSAGGLVPPPIEKDVSYDELLDLMRQGNVWSLQPAVQHDSVVVTTTAGHRLSCAVRDDEWDRLVLDSFASDRAVHILPSDSWRRNVRGFAQIFASAYAARRMFEWWRSRAGDDDDSKYTW